MGGMFNPHNVAQVIGRSLSRRDIGRSNVLELSHSSPTCTAINMSADVNQNKTKSENSSELQLWGIPLGHLPKTSQFLVLCSGVFFFYLMYGYFQVFILLPQIYIFCYICLGNVHLFIYFLNSAYDLIHPLHHN